MKQIIVTTAFICAAVVVPVARAQNATDSVLTPKEKAKAKTSEEQAKAAAAKNNCANRSGNVWMKLFSSS